MTPMQAMQIFASQRVTVTLLGDHPRLLGTAILGRSGHVHFLETSASVQVGSAVQLNTPNVILLADVLSCHPSTDRYAIVISVEHALQNVDQYIGRFWSNIKSASPVQDNTRQRTRDAI